MGKGDIDLNPDVASKDLHILDQQANSKFNSELYKLIRAGQTDQARVRNIVNFYSWINS